MLKNFETYDTLSYPSVIAASIINIPDGEFVVLRIGRFGDAASYRDKASRKGPHK